VPSEITVTTSVARRGAVSARLTRIGFTVGQELGATVAGGIVPPGVAAPVPAGVLPGVGLPVGVAVSDVVGLADPATDGEALSAGVAEPDAPLGPAVGVREPPPPAQPPRTSRPATTNGARRRCAGFMIEA
jgi:hypothetical protein